ncbi:MAG: hypothetical protein GY806_15380 [Gammaproteobacteria bacterium]|nr:hypothetical protein [Gammaproteobacteria bacterium]
MNKPNYCGIDKDHYGGMTPIGTIIKDAWVFSVLPQSETCENWSHDRLQIIHDKTKTEWDKYGCLVSNLPDDLRQRHAEIYDAATAKAREMGWNPELGDDD